MSDILEIKNLSRSFYKGNALQTAVDHISFRLEKGEILGIVGGSGSGKTTAVKMISRLLDAEDGRIFFDGQDITRAKGRRLRQVYGRMQMVFQLPAGSFHPRMTLGEGITEGMRNRGMSRLAAWQRAEELMRQCDLPPEFLKRYPHQVSGGQCQRAAFARAMATEPELLICDEITSALDAESQEKIIGLLRTAQERTGMSVLFISHDLFLVRQICNRVIVMEKGRIVEEGRPEDVMDHPVHAYTKRLSEAARYLSEAGE